MSPEERIAKLEALLARVRRHRSEERNGGARPDAPARPRAALPEEARFSEVSFADVARRGPATDASALAALDALELPDFAAMGFAEVMPPSVTVAPVGMEPPGAVTPVPEAPIFTPPPPSAPTTFTPPPSVPTFSPAPSGPPTTPAPPASRLPAIEVDVTLLERTLVTDAPVRAPEPSSVRAIETRFAEPPAMELLDLDADLALPSGAERDPFASEPELMESRSRLVTAPPARAADAEREDRVSEAEIRATTPPATPVTRTDSREARVVGPLPIDDRDLHGLGDIDELEDAAPSSSRRPITLEEKMRELDVDDDALHQAPPESGRQPAALPIDLEASPDVAAVRGTEDRVHPAHDPRDAHGAPEVTRAPPVSGESVAAFVGRPPEPRAATFGELLDDALDL